MEILQYISEGNSQIMVGKPEEAMTFYGTALSLDKNCFDAWLGMGRAFDIMCCYDEALSCCERALTLNRYSLIAECMIECLRDKVITDCEQ